MENVKLNHPYVAVTTSKRAKMPYNRLRGFEKGNNDLFNANVDSIMTAKPRSIPTNTLAIKALEIMEQHSITSLFVHKQHKPDELRGVIHIHDVLNSGI